ncbi:MAG: tetratricopeptide repeat protein, partial [Bacteroidales bacterium]|nr:tetratricopeptide repeat protein [Bacteroidales bacterium]MBN2818650.1 tetratricopeptide repeat protein [Bacteroidales bacterium]
FEKYLSTFPDGAYVLNAKFYSGDCYYQKREYDKALKQFSYVIEKPKNIYTEQALLGSARIAVSMKDYAKTVDYYSQLLKVSSSMSNIKEAKQGIMRANFALNNYSEALDACNNYLKLSGLSNEHIREAQFIKAKSLQNLERIPLALEAYQELANEVLSVQGAEAKFRVAEILFNQGKIDDAEKTILDFSNKSTSHEYWIARSFILWSDIFASRDNNFQAIETLQSIIDYYENMTDGILEMAKAKKKQFEEKSELKDAPKEAVEINIEK